MGVTGRWKWRSRWREGEEGTKEGSVCVTTRVGTYLKLFNAFCSSGFRFGRVDTRDDEIDAGVAKTICSNAPNVEVDECKV